MTHLEDFRYASRLHHAAHEVQVRTLLYIMGSHEARRIFNILALPQWRSRHLTPLSSPSRSTSCTPQMRFSPVLQSTTTYRNRVKAWCILHRTPFVCKKSAVTHLQR